MQHSKEYIEHLNSIQWQRERRETIEQYDRRCMICGYDYRERGDYLEVNHVDYQWVTNKAKNTTVKRFPLCSRHHPKGRYTWQMMRRDRRWYLFGKYARKILRFIARTAWRLTKWLWRGVMLGR